MNTAPNSDIYPSLALKDDRATINSLLQWLREVVNHRMIHTIRPVIMKIAP
jgi:dihydroorotate dehydrogenase